MARIKSNKTVFLFIVHQLSELLTLTIISFPKRFNDIHVPIRLECVKFASHCLMNHPDLAKDLTGKSAETLKFIGMKPIANNNKSPNNK